MISIILPTNRLNKTLLPKIRKIQDKSSKENDDIFNKEFIPLLKKRISGINHYIELTLKSLEEQTFKDFEIIISHKYPEDIVDTLKEYDLPIKLVREKLSIWHKLGDKYPTLCNNINTAIIHSSGDLLWRLDDLTFFNKNTLEEINLLYKSGFMMTSRGYRVIDYDDSLDINLIKEERIGINKIKLINKCWRSQYKPITERPHIGISKSMCWGFSSTISRNDFIRINGQNELFDGSISGTDMELGMRLSAISRYPRVTSRNFIYEINDIPYKYMTRDDVMFRTMMMPISIKANCWKPTKEQMVRYRTWHISKYNSIDKNWDKFMDVPFFDMKKECELKRLGKVMYNENI